MSNSSTSSNNRDDDPQRWLELAYSDQAVIAQVDDGQPGSAGWTSTSSASGPVIVAVMLAALDVHDEQRILEIGTGTGYNAALLAHRLGAEQVTTIEIDPDMATHAREALSDAGFGAVTVITGDGGLGYPARAPYDRVISTAECSRIPYPWVVQTRPGGRILTPWANSYFDGGLMALTVADGGTAWASHIHHTVDASDGEFAVQQFGPRRLWDEVEAAYRWWVGAGRPDAHRWRFTVSPDCQKVELE
jgi:protein-L-isoaspartate(D-aspartate) O-methyltransferase